MVTDPTYVSSIIDGVVVWRRWRWLLPAAIAVLLGSVVVAGTVRWLSWSIGPASTVLWVWAERASWLTGVAGLLVAILAMRPRGPVRADRAGLFGVERAPPLAPGLGSIQPGQLIEPVRGRDALIDELTQALLSGQRSRVRVLTGMGGSGKTTVARALAQRAGSAGFETWWVSAATTTDLWTGMRQVAVQAGGVDAELDRAWAGAQSAPDLLWRLLAGFRGRWLLIIDNVNEPGHLAAVGIPVSAGTGWLKPVASRRGMIMVTSRDADPATWGPWSRLHPVGMLEHSDGAQVLLDHTVGTAGTEAEAQVLAARLGGLPLALRLSGAFLRDVAGSPWPGPASTFAGYLAALDAGLLDPMSIGGEFSESSTHGVVARSWGMSLELLDRRGMTRARPLLQLLSGMAEADVPYRTLLAPEVLAASPLFTGIDGAELWRLLLGLMNLSLIECRSAPGPVSEVLRIHPLIRDASRRDSTALDQGGLLTLAAALIDRAVDQEHGSAASDDPDRWLIWQAVAPHAFHVLHVAAGSAAVSPDALAQAAHAAHLTARHLHMRGLYGQAESGYRAVFEICGLALGEEAPQTLAARHDLARVLDDRGMHKLAEDEYRTVLETCRRLLGDEHRHSVTARHNLARALHHRGQYAAAEAEYRTVLATRRRVLGEEHRQTLATRHQLARVLHNRGQLAEADAEGQEIYETERRVLGDEHPDTLITRHQLAVVLQGQGRYDRAEAEYRAVYDVQRRVLGEHHPDTLTTLHNVHRVLMNLGRLEEQLAGYAGLIEGRRRVLGDEHPATLTSKNNYAVVLHSAGRLAEAEAVVRDVRESYLHNFGEDHPDALAPADTLAAILHDQGRFAEAEQEYQRLYPIAARVLGKDHSYTLIIRHQLAGVLFNTGRYDQAEAEYRGVLVDQERALGPDSTDVLVTRHSLARLLYMQRRYDLSADECRTVVATRYRVFGDDRVGVLAPRADLALAVARLGHHDDAETEVRDVIATQTHLLGHQHPDVIATRAVLAEVLAIRGRPGRARAEARGILRSARPIFGDDHPFIHFIRLAATDAQFDWSDTRVPKPTCRTSDVFANAVSEINMPQHRHNDEW